jgi:hypothetical protein
MLLVGHAAGGSSAYSEGQPLLRLAATPIVAQRHNSLAVPQSCHYLRRWNSPRGFRAPQRTTKQGIVAARFANCSRNDITMRKIILAAAIAGAAFSVSACSDKTADAASETADSAAADASANADAATSAVTDAAADATSATSEAATDATSAATTETTTTTTTAE